MKHVDASILPNLLRIFSHMHNIVDSMHKIIDVQLNEFILSICVSFNYCFYIVQKIDDFWREQWSNQEVCHDDQDDIELINILLFNVHSFSFFLSFLLILLWNCSCVSHKFIITSGTSFTNRKHITKNQTIRLKMWKYGEIYEI